MSKLCQIADTKKPMATATHPTAAKIAIVFDFDDTLVPDTFDSLLEHLGLDASRFREEEYEPLKASGWDAIPARFFSLIRYSQSRSDQRRKVTQETIAEFGRSLQPFDGVAEMFDALRQRATELVPDVTVEFYMITSGFAEIARHTSIAKYFKAIWGCEFHYSDTGEIAFLKRSLSHPEKTRYLYYLSKGVDDRPSKDLLFVYDDVAPDELAIPLPQVVYVGDGTSDIPCFSMLNQEGGTAIGVYKEGTPSAWAKQYQPSQGQRVANLAPAVYTEDSELMKSLTLAVESVCKKIQLQQMSKHE
jgi:phosphoglycolate phosphatase-like HAD superfamily hydrolase